MSITIEFWCTSKTMLENSCLIVSCGDIYFSQCCSKITLYGAIPESKTEETIRHPPCSVNKALSRSRDAVPSNKTSRFSSDMFLATCAVMVTRKDDVFRRLLTPLQKSQMEVGVSLELLLYKWEGNKRKLCNWNYKNMCNGYALGYMKL